MVRNERTIAGQVKRVRRLAGLIYFQAVNRFAEQRQHLLRSLACLSAGFSQPTNTFADIFRMHFIAVSFGHPEAPASPQRITSSGRERQG